MKDRSVEQGVLNERLDQPQFWIDGNAPWVLDVFIEENFSQTTIEIGHFQTFQRRVRPKYKTRDPIHRNAFGASQSYRYETDFPSNIFHHDDPLPSTMSFCSLPSYFTRWMVFPDVSVK